MSADREASNAIVAQAAFYAGALARANELIERHEQTIQTLRAAMKARDDELHQARIEGDNLRASVGQMQKANAELEAQLAAEKKALATERQRANSIQNDKNDIESKYKSLQTENERLQRVNIESHNERDKNVKALRESSEALGWLKSEANQFVTKLRESVEDAEFMVDSPFAVLKAVERLVKHWNATGGDEAFKQHKPNPKPPKPKVLPPADKG